MSRKHDHGRDSQTTLLIGLMITLGFAVVEAIAGWLANSLALIGDAGHMLTDSASLGIGVFAAWLSRKPATQKHSYGLQRAEVVGALVNVLFMYGVIAAITVSAIGRLRSPVEVEPILVMLVGSIGLLVNIGVALLLHRGEQNLNVRGAMLHVMGDLLGSVAAVLAGAVIWFTGWMPIDPLLSILICILIAVSSTKLLLESLHVVMEGVPHDIDPKAVAASMVESDSAVIEVHHIHIWSVSSRSTAMSAHVVIAEIQAWPKLLNKLQSILNDKFSIDHATLQAETTDCLIDVEVAKV